MYDALTSGPNDIFNSHIQRMYDDVEAGFGFHKDFTWEDLIAAGRAKEINMKADQVEFER